ncbi:hypothetical protein O9992_28510 [Vibrio lentus]|nr:hypothetical protein [Vibrio lentus]
MRWTWGVMVDAMARARGDVLSAVNPAIKAEKPMCVTGSHGRFRAQRIVSNSNRPWRLRLTRTDNKTTDANNVGGFYFGMVQRFVVVLEASSFTNSFIWSITGCGTSRLSGVYLRSVTSNSWMSCFSSVFYLLLRTKVL